MSITEARRSLRRLELEAYAAIVSAFRAEGQLTLEKKASLTQLSQLLSISIDRHHAEVRRAICDEALSYIADCSVCGTESKYSWLPEGRRLGRGNPRLVSRHAFSGVPLCNVAAAGKGNKSENVIESDTTDKKLPPQVQLALKTVTSYHSLSPASRTKQSLLATPPSVRTVSTQTDTVGMTSTGTQVNIEYQNSDVTVSRYKRVRSDDIEENMPPLKRYHISSSLPNLAKVSTVSLDGHLSHESTSSLPTTGSTDVPLPTTVCTDISLPTTVTTDVSLPTTVSTDISLPTTVATDIHLPVTVSTDISLPTIVATDISLPTTVSTDISLPTTVATDISLPTTISTDISLPTTVSTDISLPTTVSTDIPTVATDILLPTTVSTDISLPTTVATDISVPITVSTDIPTTVSTDVSLPTTVSTDIPLPTTTDIHLPTTVSIDIPTTVSTDVPLPTMVATDIPLPTTVSTDISTTVSTDIPTTVSTDVPLPTTDIPLPTTVATALSTDELPCQPMDTSAAGISESYEMETNIESTNQILNDVSPLDNIVTADYIQFNIPSEPNQFLTPSVYPLPLQSTIKSDSLILSSAHPPTIPAVPTLAELSTQTKLLDESLPEVATPDLVVSSDISNVDENVLLEAVTTELGVESIDPSLLNMSDLLSLLQPEDSMDELALEASQDSSEMIVLQHSDELAIDHGVNLSLNEDELLQDLPPELRETVQAILESQKDLDF